jgi:hypothetical protein
MPSFMEQLVQSAMSKTTQGNAACQVVQLLYQSNEYATGYDSLVQFSSSSQHARLVEKVYYIVCVPLTNVCSR